MVEQCDTETFDDYVAGVQGSHGAQESLPSSTSRPSPRAPGSIPARTSRARTSSSTSSARILRAGAAPARARPAQRARRRRDSRVRPRPQGLALRQEIYSYDGSPQAQHPYTVTEMQRAPSYSSSVAARRATRVFHPVGRESVSLTYERNPADPRIAHTLARVRRRTATSCAPRRSPTGGGRRPITPGRGHPRPAAHLRHLRRDRLHARCRRRSHRSPVYRLRVPYEPRATRSPASSRRRAVQRRGDSTRRSRARQRSHYEIVGDERAHRSGSLSRPARSSSTTPSTPLTAGEWAPWALVTRATRSPSPRARSRPTTPARSTDADLTAAGYVAFRRRRQLVDPVRHRDLPRQSRPRTSTFPSAPRDPSAWRRSRSFDRLRPARRARPRSRRRRGMSSSAVNDYRVLGPGAADRPQREPLRGRD